MTVVWHQHHAAGSSSRPPIRNMSLVFGLAVLLLLAIMSIGYYSFAGWRHPSASRWFARVPLPVAQLGTHVGWYSNFEKLARGFAASEGRSELVEEDFVSALDLMTRRLLIAQLADKYDVKATDEEIEAELIDDEALQTFLVAAGWDLDDYRELVLEPFVVSQKVEVFLMADQQYQGGALEEMAALQAKLDLGIAFEDVAQQYSEDTSAQSKGNLGYVLPSEVDAGLAPAFELGVNVVSGVLETTDAFWIIRVEDIATSEDGDRYLLRGIAVKKQGIGEIVDTMIEDQSMRLFVRQ